MVDYRWRVSRERGEWTALEREWDQLAQTESPLADAAWTFALANAFCAADRALALHALYADGRLVAVLPLELLGSLPRAQVSLDNEHNPYWTFPLAAPSAGVARAILRHLLADADYLFFRRFRAESPMCQLLVAAAREEGLETSLIEAEAGDAFIPLVRPWEAFKKTLSENLRTDTPRKVRNLGKLGELTLEVVPAEALDAALAECLDLEGRGWKGVTGSPIRSSPETYRFYTDVARDLGKNRRFALCVLRLDGRILAFEYWLRGGGHIEMLKISFDPAHAKHSPGNVLRYLALKREIEEGESTIYHLGRPSPWKMRWTNEVKPLCTLRVYAPTLRGRAAFLAGPVLRGALKGNPHVLAARAALARLAPAR